MEKRVAGVRQSSRRKKKPARRVAVPALALPDSWGRSQRDGTFQTVSEIYRFKVDVVDLLAEHFGGQTTLNHLRVGNFIGLCCQYFRRPTSNQEIAQSLGLSRATVSRIVTDFIASGWVAESPHPEDGRKRLLIIPPDHPLADHFERALRQRMSKLIDLLQRARR